MILLYPTILSNLLEMCIRDSGSPTQVVYRDAIIGICVVVWGVLFGLLRYVV